MTPVATIEGRAYPFRRKNVDTDVIIPARWSQSMICLWLGISH
jgi:3-isopropylmalate/(R)-2-methylmalate dehydratase small subunit